MSISHTFKKVLSNSLYVVVSNLLALIISVLVVLILPKIIGVSEYGYWQLYLFYVSYVGFLHLGWVDGVFLKYGGKEYQDLEKQKFFSQFISLFIFQLIIAVAILGFSHVFVNEQNKLFVFTMLAFALVTTNVRYLFIYILQATNRIKASAWITIVDRAIYALLIILLILMGLKQYQLMVIADIIGRVISLVLAIYLCKEIVLQKYSQFKLDLTEIYDNIKVGSSLMFSNICSMLIIGIARFGIEYKWDIVTFGKISLVFSISAFLMVFINAIGVVLFPILKRMQAQDMAKIFLKVRDIFVIIMFAMLFCYYPAKWILSEWLIEYADKMIYMSIIFPIAVYEGKMALLLNTYFKALRLERAMLGINFIVMLLSIAFTSLAIFVFENLTLVIFSIVILLILRSIIFEYILAKIMTIPFVKDAFFETFVTLCFIYFNFTMDLGYAGLAYAIIFIVYIVLAKRNVLTQLIYWKN